MSEVTFNDQSLKAEAVNYTDSVDKLKQAAKPHTDEKTGIINITRGTTEEDGKKIEDCTSQINALFAGTKTEDIQQALWAKPILGNKLANLLRCEFDELPTVLSDLNKSVTNLPSILGSLLVSSDQESQKLTNTMLSVSEPFMKAVTDGDMRELLKLLIAAFAQLMTTQREADLNNLNTLMKSFQSKIDEMENAKKEQYDAAIATAVTSIVCGAVSLGLSILSTCMSVSALKKAGDTQMDQISAKTEAVLKNAQFVSTVADFSSKTGTGIGGISSAMYTENKMEADKQVEMMNMAMEIARKAREDNQSLAKVLMDAIMNLLSQLQQLNQNARQTEMQIVA